MMKSSSLAMILLSLPNDLFYNVIVDWIDQIPFITFVVLDAVVRDDHGLRGTLQSHLLFIKSKTRCSGTNFEFDQARDCYKSIALICTTNIFSKLNDEVIFDTKALSYRLNYGTNIEHSDHLISCCRSIVSLHSNDESVIEKLLPTSLKGLQEVIFEECCIKLLKPYELMLTHCHNLRVLRFGCTYVFTDVYAVMTDIVRHNPHLTVVSINATSEVLDVILEKCPNMTSIHLRTNKNDSITLMQAARLYTQLTKMKTCIVKDSVSIMQRSDGNFGVVLQDDFATQDLQSFVECMKGSLVWAMKNMSDSVLNCITKFCSNHILELECNQRKLVAPVSLSSLFDACLLLRKVELWCSRLNNDEIEEVFTHAPVTLVEVSVDAELLKVSGIVAILKQCPQLVKCYYACGIDDALTDASVAPALQEVVEDHINTLKKFYRYFI